MKNFTLSLKSLKSLSLSAALLLFLSLGVIRPAHALQGATGAHDPSTIIKRNGVYHIWTTGNQIYHMTSTDLIKWTAAPTVFAAGTWPSWINTYVSGFAGNFWAPECIYMGGKYYLYYACSTGGRPCAIGVATSTDLSTWTDQGMVVYSDNNSTYGSIDPAIFADASGNYWMTFGSHLTGIWIAQINPATGKRLNSTLKNIAGSSSSENEASYVIRSGSYYYLFYNKGVCCNGVNSTYYVQMGRSTNPDGPYTDENGTNLLSGGGTTVLSTSGKYIGPGQIGLYVENGYNFLTYHYYDGNNNGTPTLAVGNMGWSGGWPFITQDWIAAGRYKIINNNSNMVWDDWGCTGASLQAIAQNTSNGLTCQQWNFITEGNGTYRITCVNGGLSADVYNCNAANGAKLDIYAWNGLNCQRYDIARAGDGSLVFASLNGNRVVEVPNASTTAGVQLGLYDYNGCTCQHWRLGTAGVVALTSVAGEAAMVDADPDLSGQAAASTPRIYPNPSAVHEGFIVELGDLRGSVPAQIRVMNSLGQVVEELQVENGSNAVVGRSLHEGIYFIQISGKGKSIIRKVIVK